jgi:hypothetical protein
MRNFERVVGRIPSANKPNQSFSLLKGTLNTLFELLTRTGIFEL